MPAYEYVRKNPLRKPKGFEPIVQRWSVGFPNNCAAFGVTFYGVQGSDAAAVYGSAFFGWIEKVLGLPNGPSVHDHAALVDQNGLYTHIVAMYWIDLQKRAAWDNDPMVTEWWNDKARLSEATGYFRETMMVPVERQETIYWQDYPAAMMLSPDVSVYPTPYCGYYGAMRDRLPIAGVDDLVPDYPELPAPAVRDTKGARWKITMPSNVAVIRSAASWERCDTEQTDDYMQQLRAPLDRGMDFLRQNAAVTGCASLRFQQTCDITGAPRMETHALGYFLSLGHLENWAENHASHDAIFKAAISRYKRYGKSNQLRTWHEVFVLPKGQNAEYVNCAPGTGLSLYFDGERLN
ncbi:MAG: phenylacetaldoxime dehydratase family protein [Bradyrhizobiaceae bacterium]|nr:MAG: phenylacetaldoxime dehydratase family protein [Bradyrhizobiaceae bacterium]